jgi:hypothetical protein
MVVEVSYHTQQGPKISPFPIGPGSIKETNPTFLMILNLFSGGIALHIFQNFRIVMKKLMSPKATLFLSRTNAHLLSILVRLSVSLQIQTFCRQYQSSDLISTNAQE